MRRVLPVVLLVAALAATGCGGGVSWDAADSSTETELSSRYPPIGERAERLTARTVAVVALLFVVWLLADLKLGGEIRGPAPAIAAAFVTVLTVAWTLTALT